MHNPPPTGKKPAAPRNQPNPRQFVSEEYTRGYQDALNNIAMAFDGRRSIFLENMAYYANKDEGGAAADCHMASMVATMFAAEIRSMVKHIGRG